MTQQAPYPSAPVTPDTPKLPGKIGIWIGSILMALAVIGGSALLVLGIVQLANIGEGLQRVSMPEGGSITISEEDLGTQTVFAETRSLGSGSGFSTSTGRFGPSIDVDVFGPDGQAIQVQTNSRSSTTYTFDGRDGIEIGSFDARVAGRYEIRPLVGDDSGQYISIAVGSGVSLGGLFSLFGGIFGGGALFVIGLIVLIVSLVRRSSAKKAAQPATAPWGHGGPAMVAPGYAAPGQAPPPYGYQPPPPATTPGWQPPPSSLPDAPPPGPPPLPPESPDGPVGPPT